MPKRSCPFGEVAPLQLKTRVGLRELSRGVRGEEYRREVFERARRLLFRGARAYMEGAWPAGPAATCAVIYSPEPDGEARDGSAERRWRGQLLIGHDGKLLRRPA
ncbi:SIVA protein, partial [Bucco capensis]|nr:SIVA protein [Bucco capensis]